MQIGSHQIPCEFCGVLVIPQLYTQHAYRCRMVSRSDDMDVDDFDCVMQEDDIFLNSRIRHNHQVHRANVRDFLEVHGASPPSSANSQRSAASPAPSLSSWNDTYMIQYESGLYPPEKPKKPIQDITFTVSYANMKKNDAVGNTSGDASAICPICQTELADVEATKKDTIRKFAKCLHAFCHTCITRWLETKRTCPMCMSDVYEDA